MVHVYKRHERPLSTPLLSHIMQQRGGCLQAHTHTPQCEALVCGGLRKCVTKCVAIFHTKLLQLCCSPRKALETINTAAVGRLRFGHVERANIHIYYVVVVLLNACK